MVNPSTGFNLNLNEWNNKVEDNSIIISISNTNNDYGKEGYTLVVNKLELCFFKAVW